MRYRAECMGRMLVGSDVDSMIAAIDEMVKGTKRLSPGEVREVVRHADGMVTIRYSSPVSYVQYVIYTDVVVVGGTI